MSTYTIGVNVQNIRGRDMVELSANPLNAEHRDAGIYGENDRRWTEALTALGLIVITDRSAVDYFGVELPGIKARLIDEKLSRQNGNQFALLSIVSKGHRDGLGIHMGSAFRATVDEEHPEPSTQVSPRILTLEEVLGDIAKVTIGGVRRHPDIDPAMFQPTIEVCRDLGTIGLLEQQLS